MQFDAFFHAGSDPPTRGAASHGRNPRVPVMGVHGVFKAKLWSGRPVREISISKQRFLSVF